MELHEVLKNIASSLGSDSLYQNNIVNIISDFDPSAFNPISLKNITNTMATKGYLKSFLDLRVKDESQYKGALAKFINDYGFQTNQVEYIVDSFCYAKGIVKTIIPYTQRILVAKTSSKKDSISVKTLQSENKANNKNSKIIYSKRNTTTIHQKTNNSKKGTPPISRNGYIFIVLFILIVSLPICAILNDNQDNVSNKPIKDLNVTDTIYFSREVIDTLKWEDGTPKETKKIKKNDIIFLLAKDSIFIITPFETTPSIGFDFRNPIYNKEKKEMNEKHGYKFDFIGNQKGIYKYGKARDILPIVDQNDIITKISSISIQYIPIKIKASENIYNYQHVIYGRSTGSDYRIHEYFSVYP